MITKGLSYDFIFRNWEKSRKTLSARANWEMAVKPGVFEVKRLGKKRGLSFQPAWHAAHTVQCCFLKFELKGTGDGPRKDCVHRLYNRALHQVLSAGNGT